MKGKKWICVGFLKRSSVFLDVCITKVRRAIGDGERREWLLNFWSWPWLGGQGLEFF